MATVKRSARWAPPPPPQTPRILHLPRRSSTRRRKQTTRNVAVRASYETAPFHKGKLERLFHEERAFRESVPPPVVVLREREAGDVEEREGGEGGDVEEREKWRFQAEMLRAECKLLRMEREVAVKKLERERGVLEIGFKSALHSLLSGKKKIQEGGSVDSVLEEEIEDLAKKLVELQRNSKMKHHEVQKCSNFDKQASLLQRQLEKLGERADGNCVQEMQEMSGVSLSIKLPRDGRTERSASGSKSNKLVDVEALRTKMERLSKGKLLKRMEEEYGSMLYASANCSVPSSASTSRRFDLSDWSSFSLRQSSQETNSGEPRTCSGHCKSIVKRIMEQVRAETEQWSQMQEMLGQVRGEMEELQASRDFWEERALQSDYKVQNLTSQVEEWKQKAISLENKESQLNERVSELEQELESLRKEKRSECELKDKKHSVPISLGAQLAMEKRVLTCRVKGSGVRDRERSNSISVDYSDGKKAMQKNSSRHPFRDIGNLSPLVRQNSRRHVHPLHCPEDS